MKRINEMLFEFAYRNGKKWAKRLNQTGKHAKIIEFIFSLTHSTRLGFIFGSIEVFASIDIQNFMEEKQNDRSNLS